MTRLMLYNIYRGGAGRIDKIAEAVNTIRPDFLGVLEAVGWGEENQRTLQQFASKCDFPFSHFAKANTKYDLAFFSRREPLTVKETREGFWHVLLRADTRLPNGEPLTIMLFHLNPRQEEDRLRELQRVRALIDPSARVILMGDFNSLSPHDPYDRTALLQTFQEHGIENFGGTRLEFSCIETVESWGFIDVMRALGKPFAPTVPTPSNQDPMHAAPLRLDYIFVSPSLRPFLSEATVLRTPATDIASDHYPLVVDFSF